MNAYFLLFVECGMSLTASFAVLVVLSRPLLNVLERICLDEQAAIFWQSYTRLMLIIGPLLLVMVVDLFAHFRDPMDTVRLALVVVLAGLLLALHAVGRRLGQFVVVPMKTGAPS